ncbi:YtxH domain-containing protein [Agromyces bracchium]|uniref:YtxH domain-containing protein n=1 Tax=Agromyces bracchium TaxID=88376 RepID=A0A6I3M969_9MICO|nr:YtxH domain-containing protein [Agromyces bracchium]MTH67906.1 YtxH domain-containing protein [Agromyces bracchium]
MKGKILFVVGLGVGYVLGTRAGRERYEQIRKAAEGVWNQPAVQDGVQTVKDFAMARVGDVSDTVLDNAKKLVRQMSEGSTTDGSGSKSSGGAKSSASKSSTAKSSTSKSSGSGSTASKSSGSGSSTRSSSAKSGASGSKASGSSGSSSSSS